MIRSANLSRRALFQAFAIGVPVSSLWAFKVSAEPSTDLPLLNESESAAIALQYTEDASRAKDAKAGATCLNCSAYSGANNAAFGPCTLFPGKAVKAAGWCSAWTDM